VTWSMTSALQSLPAICASSWAAASPAVKKAAVVVKVVLKHTQSGAFVLVSAVVLPACSDGYSSGTAMSCGVNTLLL
jgi:hypothetical protein